MLWLNPTCPVVPRSQKQYQEHYGPIIVVILVNFGIILTPFRLAQAPKACEDPRLFINTIV